MKEDVEFDLYSDIASRTNGEIYLGIVGPVRTGKSTFIKRFVEQLILPNITDEHEHKRTIDELPQSGNGKAIMTTEPKFIPKTGVNVRVSNECEVKLRLIDCVGYLVDEASGYIEDYKERLVKTPWFDEELPFSKAAHIGTEKVIKDHSTVGIVVTTDGTFGEIDRENFVEAEKKTINELKQLGKPFIVILNSVYPNKPETINLAQRISKENQVYVLPCNCQQLSNDDINKILKCILYEFPITQVSFQIPKWLEMLELSDDIMLELIENTKSFLNMNSTVRDVKNYEFEKEMCKFIKNIEVKCIKMDSGHVDVKINMMDELYFKVLSKLANIDIKNEYEHISFIKELAQKKDEFERVAQAINSVKATGYGFVTADRDEIVLEEPAIIKNGNKYGININAKAPTIHMISAQIETQISPIVGSKQEAMDLIDYIKNDNKNDDGIWDTNIFGKTIEQIVDNGIDEKIHNMTNENVDKIRGTLQKVMNENNGLVCIIV